MTAILQVTEQPTAQRYFTPEEYLALEETAEYKSEYLDGEIIPTALPDVMRYSSSN